MQNYDLFSNEFPAFSPGITPKTGAAMPSVCRPEKILLAYSENSVSCREIITILNFLECCYVPTTLPNAQFFGVKAGKFTAILSGIACMIAALQPAAGQGNLFLTTGLAGARNHSVKPLSHPLKSKKWLLAKVATQCEFDDLERQKIVKNLRTTDNS